MWLTRAQVDRAAERLVEQRRDTALAVPSIEPAGQASCANWTRVQMRPDVGVVEQLRARQRRDRRCAMFASPGSVRSTAWRAGWPRRLIAPRSLRPSSGRRRGRRSSRPGSAALGAAARALSPASAASTVNGSQLVGLRVKLRPVEVDPDRAQPQRDASRICGSGSETAVICASIGVDVDRDPDDDVAEVVGARDGRGDDREAQRRALVGAGEVDLAGQCRRDGCRRPAPATAVPIWLAAGQAGA